MVDGPALVARVARAHPEAVELAELASVATVIEPALLRRLRRRLRPRHDAGTEADLWASRLVAVASATTATFRPEVLAELRRRLVASGELDGAHAVVEAAHVRHSEFIRLEERVIWAHLRGSEQDVRGALAEVYATLRLPRRAPDVVRWFGHARRRLPPEVLETEEGRAVLGAVALHLDRVVPPEILAAQRFPDAATALAPSGLPLTRVGVELAPGGLRFVDPAGPEAGHVAVLDVPDTRPLVLEASWNDGAGARTAVVRADLGTAASLPGLTPEGDGTIVRTLAGQRFALRSSRERKIVVANFDRELDRTVPRPPVDGVLLHWVDAPTDLTGRPEIVVVPALDGVLDPAQRSVLEDFTVLGARRNALDGTGRGPAAVVVVGTSASPSRISGLGDAVYSATARDASGLAAALRGAAAYLVAHPHRLYDVTPEEALGILQSIALTFHVRATHRDVVPDDAEAAFFGLGDEAAQETFNRVRGQSEWTLAGPVRAFLQGGPDPTLGYGDEPMLPGHPSTSVYLTWYLGHLHHYLSAVAARFPDRWITPFGGQVADWPAARALLRAMGAGGSVDPEGAVSLRAVPAIVAGLEPIVVAAVRTEESRRSAGRPEPLAAVDAVRVVGALPSRIARLVWTGDRQRIVAVASDGSVEALDLTATYRSGTRFPGGPAVDLAAHADGRSVHVATRDQVFLWSFEPFSTTAVGPEQDEGITAVVSGPAVGTWVGTARGNIQQLEGRSGRLFSSVEGIARRILLDPSGERLIVATDQSVRRLDPLSGTAHLIARTERPVLPAVLGGDRRAALAVPEGDRVVVVDPADADGGPIGFLRAAAEVQAVAWSPSGHTVGATDEEVLIWRDGGSMDPERRLDLGGVRPTAIAVSPDGGTLAVGCADGSVVLAPLPGVADDRPVVFVTYQFEDRHVAAAITERLAQWGDALRVVMDPAAERRGEDWSTRLGEAVATARVVVLVVGPQWRAEEWLSDEFALATLRGAYLVPVLYDREGPPHGSQWPEALVDAFYRDLMHVRSDTLTADAQSVAAAVERTLTGRDRYDA